MRIESRSTRSFVCTAFAGVVLAIACCGWAVGSAEAGQGGAALLALQAQPAAPGDGFEPVGQLPVKEQLPAAPMVMTAYAIVWILTIGFVVSVWRRLDRVERELRDVEKRVAQEARRS